MSENLQKRAADMLLKGATLLGEPCPYCKGVRVMSQGHALCVNCGSEPEPKNIIPTNKSSPPSSIDHILQQKIDSLSKELAAEDDHQRQQSILKTINMLLDTANKAKA